MCAWRVFPRKRLVRRYGAQGLSASPTAAAKLWKPAGIGWEKSAAEVTIRNLAPSSVQTDGCQPSAVEALNVGAAPAAGRLPSAEGLQFGDRTLVDPDINGCGVIFYSLPSSGAGSSLPWGTVITPTCQ